MKHTESPLFTTLWDVAQAEQQLTLLTKQYEQLRALLPDETLSQTTLISDELRALQGRLATVKHNLIALVHQEK